MARSSIVGFRDVDASHDPADLIHCLQAVSEVPFVRERARLARSRIAPGHAAADLGCGLGGDTLMLARHVGPGGGQATGIDRSRAMLDHARARPDAAGLPVEFREGDIRGLPFPDASLDACWTERVLIHADDPAAVLAEVAVRLPDGATVTLRPRG